MKDVTLAADIQVVCGASGSGKSAWVKEQIADDERVSVFDTDAEYCDLSGFRRVRTIKELIGHYRKSKRGRFAYVPAKAMSPELFDLWSQATYAWGNCTAVAEELAGVTSPGKAPQGWHMLVTRGRKRGIRVIGITQRPAESDKTIIGNATLIHCGLLARANDRAYMAREMDCAQHQLDRLLPLEFLERNRAQRTLEAGKLSF